MKGDGLVDAFLPVMGDGVFEFVPINEVFEIPEPRYPIILFIMMRTYE